MNSAVIVDIVRTATGKGKPGGALSRIHPADLLATVLRELIGRTGIDPVLVDDSRRRVPTRRRSTPAAERSEVDARRPPPPNDGDAAYGGKARHD